MVCVCVGGGFLKECGSIERQSQVPRMDPVMPALQLTAQTVMGGNDTHSSY